MTAHLRTSKFGIMKIDDRDERSARDDGAGAAAGILQELAKTSLREWEVELGAGPAREIRLVAKDGHAVVVGALDASMKTAAIGTLGYAAAVCERFHAGEAAFAPGEYLAFADGVRQQLGNLGYHVAVLGREQAPAPASGPHGKHRLLGLFGVAIASVATASIAAAITAAMS